MTLLRQKTLREKIRHDLYRDLEAEGVSIVRTFKDLRKMLAQDQTSFSKMVGLSLATIRKIEQEGGNVTLASLQKVLDKFSLELVVRIRKKA